MKAKLYNQIRTFVPVPSKFREATMYPPRMVGTIVECYAHPEAYVVDLAIPSARAINSVIYDNVHLEPHQFELVTTRSPTSE